MLSINILISSPQQTGSCLGVSLGTPSATLGQSWRPGAPCHSSRSSSMRRPPSRPYLAPSSHVQTVELQIKVLEDFTINAPTTAFNQEMRRP